MSTVLVPLAAGCEELEAVTIVDLLRRANIDVVTAGLDPHPVRASRGMTLVPNTDLDMALQREFDMIVLPGGLPGAEHLAKDARLMERIKAMHASGKYVCAICAAPAVLAKAGVLQGKRATSYPGILDPEALPEVTYTGSAVEVHGNVVTSRGPGTAMDFALQLIELLAGAETRTTVEQGLVRT